MILSSIYAAFFIVSSKFEEFHVRTLLWHGQGGTAVTAHVSCKEGLRFESDSKP